MTFTLYENAHTTSGEAQSAPWEKWVALFGGRAEREAKDGPAVALARVEGRRASANVREVHALALDVEHRSDAEVSAALDRLLPFEWFAWTTHRHGEEPTPRVRVVVPLAEPHLPGDHASAWARFDAFVGGVNDPSTKDPARLHYLPSAPAARFAEAWSVHNAGRFLSLADLPEAPARRPADRKATSADVEKVRVALRRVPTSEGVKDAARAVLAGEAFAAPGARHQAILDLTWWVAANAKALPPDAVGEAFRKSLEASEATDQSPADVAKAYEGALAKVDDFRAEQRDHEKGRAREEARREQLAGTEPYTSEDLARIAAVQGCEVADLARRWVVQRDSTYYFLRADGTYTQPASYMEARPEAAQALKRAPVLLNEVTRAGLRRRTIIEIVEDHGCKALDVLADLQAQYTTFDGKVLREAVCPRRPLEPRFDERIDRWLRALGGEQADRLLDWLAVAPDLSKLLCALYLSGSAGAGKTLLAKGLARVWTEGAPTEIANILDKNNEELAKCPLILADEAVPRKWKNAPTTTALRRIISESSRTLSRKYKAPASLVGATRFVLTANNEFLLHDADEAPGANDREAVARRFLYIEVGPDAEKVLSGLIRQGVSLQGSWLDGDGIARHVLHLAGTREVAQEGRFWVEGGESSMARRLAVGGSDWNQFTCEWLVRYVMQPNLYDARKDGRVRRGGGELLVNAQAISDGWGLYLKSRRDPDVHRIGQALAAISVDRIQRRSAGKRVWYHKVDLTNLLDWAGRTGVGDEETIRAAVDVPAPKEEP